MHLENTTETDPAEQLTASQLHEKALVLSRAGRKADAEALLLAARKTHPDDGQLAIDYAELAEAAGDWPETVRRYEMVIENFPDGWWSYSRLAAALVQLGRLDEAERVLEEGQRQVPGARTLLLDYGNLAERRGDWSEAIRRFEAARRMFPDDWWAYARIAACLKQLGRLDEADRILEDAKRQLPQERALFIDYGTLAEAREDWPEAIRRFEVVIEKFPDDWWAYARVAACLRHLGRLDEAERILQEGQRQVPQERALFIDFAALAEGRADWLEAIRRFEVVKHLFPDDWWAYARIAASLLSLGRADEAERILQEGQLRIPQAPALFIDYGTLAELRGDWPEALRRFETVREKFPGEWWSYARISAALRNLGRIAEAEHVLEEGQRQAPDVPALFIDYGALAELRGDWPAAISRFEMVRERFPDEWWPYSRIAACLRKLDKVREAESVLEEGQRRFPHEAAMFLDHAALAESVWDWKEALRRFENTHALFPQDWWAYFGLARNMVENGKFSEAESLRLEMLELFPDKEQPLIDLVYLSGSIAPEARQISLEDLDRLIDERAARTAMTAALLDAKAHIARLECDYEEYLKRLLVIVDRFPDFPGINEKVITAREIVLGTGGPAEPVLAASQIAHGAGPDDITVEALLLLFESLGGGGPNNSTVHGCEFGFIQRHHKIEPLSLLRWSGTSLPDITRALEAEFEHVGSPDSTVLKINPSASDWGVIDTTYNINCDHTHLERLTVPEALAHRMMCQRMSYLSRKLIEDLEDGEKLFVYRYSGPMPDQDDVLRLARAVNRFGNNVLLFVCRADETHPPFSVHRMHDGLMIGYLDWFALDRVAFPWNVEGWISLCRNAYREWMSARPTIG